MNIIIATKVSYCHTGGAPRYILVTWYQYFEHVTELMQIMISKVIDDNFNFNLFCINTSWVLTVTCMCTINKQTIRKMQ
jgi:hypothetical protein